MPIALPNNRTKQCMVVCGRTPATAYDPFRRKFLKTRHTLVFLRGRFEKEEAVRFCKDTFATTLHNLDVKAYFAEHVDMIAATAHFSEDQFPPHLNFMERYFATLCVGILDPRKVDFCDCYEWHLCWHLVHKLLEKPIPRESDDE